MPDLRWYRDGVLPLGDGTAGPVDDDEIPEVEDPPGEPVGKSPWDRACEQAAFFRLLSGEARDRLRRRRDGSDGEGRGLPC